METRTRSETPGGFAYLERGRRGPSQNKPWSAAEFLPAGTSEVKRMKGPWLERVRGGWRDRYPGGEKPRRGSRSVGFNGSSPIRPPEVEELARLQRQEGRAPETGFQAARGKTSEG
jgi:hypothetical protein